MSWSKSLLAVGCFSVLVGGGIFLFQHLHYRINLSDSLPRGLYRETSDVLQYGSLVAVCLPPDMAAFGKARGWLGEGSCSTNTPPILKQVVGMPGDTVDLADEYVAVTRGSESIVLPHSATQKTDSQGRPLPAIPRGTYVLGPGEVFLLATNIPNSWDNRYTGPTRITDIITTARAVWTEAKHAR